MSYQRVILHISPLKEKIVKKKKEKIVSLYQIRWTSRSSNYFYKVEKQNIYRN